MFETRLKVLNCKIILKMQKAKTLWLFREALRALQVSSVSVKERIICEKFLLVPSQFSKEPTKSYLPEHSKQEYPAQSSQPLPQAPRPREVPSPPPPRAVLTPLTFLILSFTLTGWAQSPAAAICPLSLLKLASLYLSPGLKQQLPTIPTITCGEKQPHPFRLNQEGPSHPSALTKSWRGDNH